MSHIEAIGIGFSLMLGLLVRLIFVIMQLMALVGGFCYCVKMIKG